MHRNAPVSGPRVPDDPDTGSPLPLRATAIVLSLWIVGLVFLAFFLVPLIFATCFPQPSG